MSQDVLDDLRVALDGLDTEPVEAQADVLERVDAVLARELAALDEV